ncbi:MAG: hypothetical protein AAGG51_02460 [Cyanobacteria bacterium P01_G01_bin.54]
MPMRQFDLRRVISRPLSRRVLEGLLPLSLGLGVGTTLVGGAIAPPPAVAYLILETVELQRQPADTYSSFLTRAQAIAATTAQRQFEQDVLASEVSITVLGRNNGAMTAVLRLRVSRHDWQRYPDARYWVTYFSSARMLLGFPQSDPTPEPQAPPPNSAPPGETPEFPELPELPELP